MAPKTRHVINRFLLWAPATVCLILGFAIGIALQASEQWPEAKSAVESWYSWASIFMNGWALLVIIALALSWLAAFLYTLDFDDKSTGGIPVGGHKAEKLFSPADKEQAQEVVESSHELSETLFPPDFSETFSGISLEGATVQIRTYSTTYKSDDFGIALRDAIAASGIRTLDFGYDSGTRYINGVVIEPAPNDKSQRIAGRIDKALTSVGVAKTLGAGPKSWGDEVFIRIGIGAI